jgi:hypothetical protein
MDQVTFAILLAISAGVIEQSAQSDDAVISKLGNELKELLASKFKTESELIQAMMALQSKPDSDRRKRLMDEVLASKIYEDPEVLSIAQRLTERFQFQLSSKKLSEKDSNKTTKPHVIHATIPIGTNALDHTPFESDQVDSDVLESYSRLAGDETTDAPPPSQKK